MAVVKQAKADWQTILVKSLVFNLVKFNEEPGHVTDETNCG